MDDLLSEFLTETTESLEELDVELVRLEQDPNDPELISSIFRLVHTIKGTCGFLGLPRLESVAHAGENVLGKFRDRELEVTPEAVSLVLEALDTIKELLAVLEETEAEAEGHDNDLIARLNELAKGGPAKAAPTEAAAPEPMPEPAAEPAAPEPAAGAESELPEPEADEFGFVPVPAHKTAELAEELAATAGAEGGAKAETEAPAAGTATAVAPAAAKPPAKTEQATAARDKERSVASQSIRVSVDLLENLMTTVGELVLTRNQLLQMLRGLSDSEFAAPLQRLSHITTELQENVMKTRMQPIGNAWAKLPRIVRDIGQELNKKIELEMVGADTELDRQVLELIRDPLTHMVRNSGDHGLETPKERLAAGKTEVGSIALNAYHEGGHIIIEISDDGRGINVEKVKQKVVENGLATEADLEAMSDEQIQQFIFKAGFSTATRVTAVSGRGVGMDVVRTNIEKIGGTVEMKSVEGKGSTFVIKIPLTLAIVSALIVEAGGELFCMPQISVVELVRASETSEHRIEMIKDTPVLRLRDQLLPLISLSQALNLDGGGPVNGFDETFIIVVHVGAQHFGVIVDKVYDTEEIVVKPVAPILRGIELFSGNTILGDGSVVMILDPNGMASLIRSASPTEQAEEKGTAVEARRDTDLTSLLLFRAGPGAPKAVPLALVARLEEINMGDVELSGSTPVIQYRGELMPLVAAEEAAGLEDSGKRPVLVFADRDRKMGLVVDEILDIVEERLKIETTVRQPGFLGSAVLAGKATDLIDVSHFATRAHRDWFIGDTGRAFGEMRRKCNLLFVEDSTFFRHLLTPLLSVEGYEVTAVENAEAALKLREAGRKFDLIISDIDMPGIDGFEFASDCRNDPRWRDTPLVALSSHAAPEDFERGREVGFNDYVAKSDRDALLASLQQVLASAGERA